MDVRRVPRLELEHIVDGADEEDEDVEMPVGEPLDGVNLLAAGGGEL